MGVAAELDGRLHFSRNERTQDPASKPDTHQPQPSQERLIQPSTNMAPPTRRPRNRSQSSLNGMMFDETPKSSTEFSLSSIVESQLPQDSVDADLASSTTSTPMTSPVNSLTGPDRVSLSLGLRRAKRRLLLAAAAPSEDSVTQLQDLFRHVSVGQSHEANL